MFGQRVWVNARFLSRYANQAQLQRTSAGSRDDDALATSSDAPAAAALPSPDCEAGLRQLRSQWQADSSRTDSGFWPLELRFSGVACGNAVIQNLRLDYDPAQRHYPSPELDSHCR